MADTSGSVSSWPGFVDQLNKTFMLVRDAFGYALPGAVFLAIGLISGRFTLPQVYQLLLPYHMPMWMAFTAMIAVSYAVGGVMAATAYMPFMLMKYFVWIRDRHWPEQAQVNQQTKTIRTWLTEWLADHPTEVTSKILEIHVKHHELSDVLDRRETLTILAGSIAAALLTGWYVFYEAKWCFAQILVAAGVVTFIQFLTGLPHLRRVASATYAAKVDPPKADPNFSQLLADLIKAATAGLTKLGS